MLIDTHTHLFMEPLLGDLGGVLARARAAGVGMCIVPAYDIDSWSQLRDLAGHEGVHTASGLHPWVADQPLDLHALEAQLTETRAVAVGEIGLDFKVPGPGPEIQIDIFRKQLELAVDLDLPVILHNRGAFREMSEILRGFGGRVRGVLHAFSRGPELAREYTNLGLHLAFGGAITRPGARHARRSAATTPDEWILLETDSPSIGLHETAPAETEPRHVRDIARELAALRDTDPDDIERTTTDNARRLFKLP